MQKLFRTHRQGVMCRRTVGVPVTLGYIIFAVKATVL